MAKKKQKKVKKVRREKTRSRDQRVVVQVQSLPAVIPTLKDLEPITENNKFTIAKTWVSEKQVLRMVQKTPPQYIYERPAKGGGKWKYVTGNYVEKILNLTFGWNWDFDVIDKGKEGDMVWVLGKLTVKDDHGHSISKSQFGRADIKFKRDSKIMLDYGNDLKSATTDALKKCSSLLGIAADVYGKAEIKQETGKDINDDKTPTVDIDQAPAGKKELKTGQKLGPDGEPTWICENEGDPISDQEAEYSMKIYKKRLCRECQAEAKSKK